MRGLIIVLYSTLSVVACGKGDYCYSQIEGSEEVGEQCFATSSECHVAVSEKVQAYYEAYKAMSCPDDCEPSGTPQGGYVGACTPCSPPQIYTECEER